MYTGDKYVDAESFLDRLAKEQENGEEKLVKSKQRVKDAGEVFTPRWVVRDMLDLDEIKDMSFELDTTFLEPACGNGNFIIQILVRKLMSVSAEAFDIDVARSVASIYGVDIAEDNVKETRARMMNAIKHFYADNGMKLRSEIECSLWYILYRNIILGNTLEYKKYAEHYSQKELVTSRAYDTEDAAISAKNSTEGLSIVDTRANGFVDDDGRKKVIDNLLVSEWKFNGSRVHRAEFKVEDMSEGHDALVLYEYETVPFSKLYKVHDSTGPKLDDLI